MNQPGCPVMVVSHALTKDNEKDNLVAQVKFENKSDKKVIALYATLKCFDVMGNAIGKDDTASFLDLNAGKYEQFGGNKAIILSDNEVRSYYIIVNKVVFEDQSFYENSNGVEMTKFEAVAESVETLGVLKKYYLSELKKAGVKTEVQKTLPLESDEYTVCGCGKILESGAALCPECNMNFVKVKEILSDGFLSDKAYQEAEKMTQSDDLETVKKGISALEEIKYIKDVAAAVDAANSKVESLNQVKEKQAKKKRKQRNIILGAVCACILCFAVVFVAVIMPMRAKAKAYPVVQFVKYLKNDAIDEASDLYFGTLGSYDQWDDGKVKQLQDELEGMYADKQFKDLVKVVINLDDRFLSAMSQPISGDKLIHACEEAGKAYLNDKDFYAAVRTYVVKGNLIPGTDAEKKKAARLEVNEAANKGLKYYITSNNLDKAIDFYNYFSGEGAAGISNNGINFDAALRKYIRAQRSMSGNRYNSALEEIFSLKSQLADIDQKDEMFPYYNALCSLNWVDVMMELTEQHVFYGNPYTYVMLKVQGLQIYLNGTEVQITNILDDGLKSGEVQFAVGKWSWNTDSYEDYGVLYATKDYLKFNGNTYYKSEWKNS